MDDLRLLGYDRIIVAFSGGKDSIAAVLHLLDLGVPRERIELWHHEIDGREGSTLMDWPVTPAYCAAFASALGLRHFVSWKVGGFEREMLRDNAPTAPTRWENPDGTIGQTGGKGKSGTRLRFPQVAADLSVRWCSAYLKIDVMSAAIRNQPRFRCGRTLVVTGERAEESPCRARYKTEEAHRADGGGRRIGHWRPIHAWDEAAVWAIIERHRINPHPAYKLGWSRVSCAGCIFGNADQFASLMVVNPDQCEGIAGHEEGFGVTIKRKKSIPVLVSEGTPYPATADPYLRALATGRDFPESIVLAPGEWRLPAGAFGESAGPV